jgi:hypothetical protein
MKATLKSQNLLVDLLAAACTLAVLQGVLTAADWKVDTVDSTGAAMYTSMKIDKTGNVHIAYVPEIDGHPLKYAFWDSSVQRWFTMKVGGQASFCTLVLDSRQYPRISYADYGTGLGAKLQYAYWNGGAWTIEPIVIQIGAVVAYYTSIALDAHDKPFLSYYDYADPTNAFRLRMRSVFWMGNYWEAKTVDPQGGSGKFNSIAVDSKGNPHIAYANVKYETAGLRYASWDGRAWNTQLIEGTTKPTPVYSVALVLDKDDNPHIAYSDVENGLLKYATRSKGAWQLQTIDSQGAGYPDRNGIALDSQGNPYLSYYDQKEGRLEIAFRKNGKWMREVVEHSFAGFTSSVAVAGDTLWVSYADSAQQSLKVAHRPLDPAVSPQAEAGVSVAQGKH